MLTNNVVSFEQPGPSVQAGEATLLSFVSASLLKRYLLLKKKFAPKGANSSLNKKIPFKRSLVSREAKEKSQKLFPFEILQEKHGSVSLYLNIQCNYSTFI